ncbi:MAG: hypothetical protein HY092_01520, partial [Candidatus Kerfeldbacteria bacterium]|nr:hypothetical protein [Candidatus Kerfeldbacteria bacterium]
TVAENQCLSLVGCNQINDKGQCVNPLPTGQCSNDPIRFCNVDSDCTAGGTCNLSSAQDPAAGLLDLTYNHPSSVGSIADLSGNVLAGLDWTQNGANIIPGKLPWQLMRQLGGDALITNGDFEATQPPSVAPWQPAPTRGLPFGQPPATLHAEFEDQNNSTNHVLRVSPGLQTNWGCIVNNICPSGSAKSGAACTSAADCPPGGTYEQFSGVASPPFSATRGTLYYGEVRIKAVTGNPKLRIQFGYDDYTSFNVTVNNKNFHTYVDVTATTAWQRVAVGPIQGMTGLTKFAVVCADANNCGPFFVDDIQVRPFLQVDTAPHFVTPSCRLFPKTDARSCDYTDQTGVTFKGWKGYCLDHDSATGICLSWWPVDIIKGEGNIFGSEPVAGYQDRAPLYFCSQAQGGPLYADLKMTNTELGDVKNEMRFDWFNIGGSGATYCVDDDGSCPVSVSGAPALPKIRYEDIDQYQVLVDVNDNESRWGTTSPNYEFQSTVSKAGGTSQYLINVLQNIHHETVKIPDSGGTFNFADSGTTYDDQYWGWGGFCLPGAFDCKTYLQKHTFMELFKNLCDTSPDLNYLVVALKFDPNTHFIKDTMVKLCDSGSGDIGNNGLVSFRPIVKAHQSCDQIIQTVQSPAQGALNKAWAQRTQQNSGYTIPDLGIGYGNDKAPFGALLAPNPADNPSAWTVLTAAEPSADPQTPARAGTPYSCVLSCGTGPLDTKYCLSSELPQDLSTASCEGASCKTGTENRCQTVADIQSCNTRVQSSLNGNAFCVGNPLGRCSNNRTKACATDNDCGKGNSCSNPAGGSAKGVNSSFGIDRIKRLFAQSYGCWGLQFGTTLVPDPTVPSGTLTQVTSSYSSGFGCIAASSWDIYTDGPNNFPKLCLSNTRPAFDPVNGTDYCAIQPTVTNASLVNITNGTCSNNAAVTCSSDAACGPSNHCVTNITGGSTTAAIKFNTAVDAEQVPLDTISIDWGDSGANSQDTISFKAAPRTDKNNPLIFSHVYTVNAGDPACSKNSVGLLSCVYHPKVQLKDGWGICNANDGTCDDGSSANWEDTKIVIHLTQ